MAFDSWNIDGAEYTGNSDDVSGSLANVQDLRYRPDGSQMFVIEADGAAGNTDIAWWDLSTDYDPSSKSNAQTVNFTAEQQGLDFSKSGDRMWTSEGDLINQWNLSTSYDPSTKSLSDTASPSEVDTQTIRGVFVGNNGNKLFLITEEVTIYEYDFDSANDITNLTFQNSQDLSEFGSRADGLFFESNGDKFFATDPDNDRVLEYTTSSSWSLSSAPSKNAELDVSGEDSSARGPAFGQDGDNILVGGDSNTSVYQYQVEDLPENTTSSFETFPDVPRTLERTPRSDAMTSTKQNEFRDYNQLNDRIFYRYEVSMEVMSPSEQDKVERLFITHQGFSGSANNVRFHFQDPDDKAVNDVQFGTGDGVTTKFQLKNDYSFGSQTETFPQGHVEGGTLSVTNDGSTVSDSDMAVDYDAGTVEFHTAPADGNVLKATFDYYKLVQFANSQINAELNTPTRRSQSVELVEVQG